MTLPLPHYVDDYRVQGNFDEVARQFPLQDRNLASPDNPAPRSFTPSYTAGMFTPLHASNAYLANQQNALVVSGGANTQPYSLFSLTVPAANVPAGKSLYVQVCVQAQVNGVAVPASTHSYGATLYPISVGGVGGNLTWAAGASTGISAVTAYVVASGEYEGSSAWTAAPANSWYALVLSNAAVLPANSAVAVEAWLNYSYR